MALTKSESTWGGVQEKQPDGRAVELLVTMPHGGKIINSYNKFFKVRDHILFFFSLMSDRVGINHGLFSRN